MSSHHDSVLQQKIVEMRTLLSRIERGVWFPNYFEFQFGKDFDASFFVIKDDGGHDRIRFGNPRDILVIRALRLFFCTAFDAKGNEVAKGMVSAFEREYARRQSGKTAGMNWMRFCIPEHAQRFFLHATRLDGSGMRHQVGQSFYRPT